MVGDQRRYERARYYISARDASSPEMLLKTESDEALRSPMIAPATRADARRCALAGIHFERASQCADAHDMPQRSSPCRLPSRDDAAAPANELLPHVTLILACKPIPRATITADILLRPQIAG